jgi:guanylate kinase
MSEQTKKNHGLLIVLCGPSGVGKSTISRMLAERLNVSYTVSATTRPKTSKDDEGKTYEYVDQSEFFRRLDGDQFLEYAHVYGHYYGTPKHPALDYLASGRDVLLEIDVQGALQVRYSYPNALMIFILPPDASTLLGRLETRGRDSAEDVSKRFRAARREIHMAKGGHAFDFMIFNDDLQRAVGEIENIIKVERAGGI